jgi:hypothetical protein
VTAASTSAGVDNNTNAVIYAQSMVWLNQGKERDVEGQGVDIKGEDASIKVESDDGAQENDGVVANDLANGGSEDELNTNMLVHGEVNKSESGDVAEAVVAEKDRVGETLV